MRIAPPSSHLEAVSEMSYSFIPPKELDFLARLHRVLAESAPVISDKFPVFRYPSFCVFNNTDQIKPEEKVCTVSRICGQEAVKAIRRISAENVLYNSLTFPAISCKLLAIGGFFYAQRIYGYY